MIQTSHSTFRKSLAETNQIDSLGLMFLWQTDVVAGSSFFSERFTGVQTTGGVSQLNSKGTYFSCQHWLLSDRQLPGAITLNHNSEFRIGKIFRSIRLHAC
jgi:hypothetical protein